MVKEKERPKEKARSWGCMIFIFDLLNNLQIKSLKKFSILYDRLKFSEKDFDCNFTTEYVLSTTLKGKSNYN